MLSQAAEDAKGEEYSWCLATITTELDLANSSDPTTDPEINIDNDEEPAGQP